jgi:hypothetical protein
MILVWSSMSYSKFLVIIVHTLLELHRSSHISTLILMEIALCSLSLLSVLVMQFLSVKRRCSWLQTINQKKAYRLIPVVLLKKWDNLINIVYIQHCLQVDNGHWFLLIIVNVFVFSSYLWVSLRGMVKYMNWVVVDFEQMNRCSLFPFMINYKL